jgi:SAM-dependent methyltransferase
VPNYEDSFSKQAAIYARYRPTYPTGLFGYLAGIAPGHDLAWDCGCGSGQAALGLAEHFATVIGTDASVQQLRQASGHGRVQYRVALAERSGFASGSVDLVTVAQALHWFDLPKFYAEVKRVLRPSGVVAAWCYHLTIIAPIIDALLTRYHQEIVGPFWSPNAQLANEHYRDIRFPFEELQSPSFVAQADWELNDVIGYLTSWSATQKFRVVHGHSPVDNIRDELANAWGNPHFKRRVRWPLYLRVGRVA